MVKMLHHTVAIVKGFVPPGNSDDALADERGKVVDVVKSAEQAAVLVLVLVY